MPKTSYRIDRFAAAAAVAASIAACDGSPFFFEPKLAAGGMGNLALVLTTAGEASLGMVSDWDRADRIWIRLERAGAQAKDTIVTITPGATEQQVQIEFELETEDSLQLEMAVELRQGEQPLLRSFGSPKVVKQQTTAVELRLVATTPVIAAGYGHTCALNATGAAHCWGRNDRGQLGDPNTPWIGSTTPVAVSGGLTFKAIDSNGYFSCGLAEDGAAHCWGANVVGQVGNGTVLTAWPWAQTAPEAVAGGHSFIGVAVGGYWEGWQDHACGLTADGSAYCWGDNDYGQLGDGSTTDSPTPSAVTGGIKFGTLAAGNAFTCGISTSGETYCWGKNEGGQTGIAASTRETQPVRVAGGLRFVAIDVGTDHGCGIVAGGAVYCWGANWAGQLGTGESGGSSATPAPVSTELRFTSVTVGDVYSCAITTDSRPHCWGLNHGGRMGTGTLGHVITPTPVAGELQVRAISAGGMHACAGTVAGTLHCWGGEGHGELGEGSRGYSDIALAVPGSIGFAQVDVGGTEFTCGRKDDGAAYCWGTNWAGQLGNGQSWSPLTTATPVAVAGGHIFKHITAGGRHACGILAANSPTFPQPSEGIALCWGASDFNQLGSDGGNSTSPRTVSGGLRFSDLTAGDEHTCGLVAGKAYCWGVNDRGQLGDGSVSNRAVPTAVAGELTFTVIAAAGTGGKHTCGITTTGAAYCWGGNKYGELGDGTTTQRTTPTLVAGGLTFTKIDAAGAFAYTSAHTCAVDASGSAYCWGFEGGCRLGNGSCAEVNRSTPTAVAGGLTFSNIATGSFTSCGIADFSEVYCWGANHSGELGNGHRNELHGGLLYDPGSGFPVEIEANLAFTGIAARHHVCGIVSGGGIYCWGPRGEGSLGDGESGYAVSPRQVSALTIP